MAKLFKSIINKILLEDKSAKEIKYEDIPDSDFINGPMYVYHMTAQENLKGGILKSGWESYYNAVNSYGPGIYTCIYPSFDKRANVTDWDGVPNPMLDEIRKWEYGSKANAKDNKKPAVMLLGKTVKEKPLNKFVICDVEMAKLIYKNKWHLRDQLLLLLGEKIYNKHRREIDIICSMGYTNTYTNAKAIARIDEMCNDIEVNKKIKGLIFHGHGDGFVAIFRDYNSVMPIGVSRDLGHIFKPIDTEYEFEHYSNNNIDIRSELGVDRFYNVKTNMAKRRGLPFDYLPSTFLGDYAVVGKNFSGNYYNRKKDMKWNFLYKAFIKNENYKDMVVSKKIWFDSVSEIWHNDTCMVLKDGNGYTIRNMNDKFILYDAQGKEIGDLSVIDDNDIENHVKDKLNNKKDVETKEKPIKKKKKFGFRKVKEQPKEDNIDNVENDGESV